MPTRKKTSATKKKSSAKKSPGRKSASPKRAGRKSPKNSPKNNNNKTSTKKRRKKSAATRKKDIERKIKKVQRDEKNLLRKAPTTRLMREILNLPHIAQGENTKIQDKAVEKFRELLQNYLTNYLDNAAKIATAAKRVTVSGTDVSLVRQIREGCLNL